MTKQTNKLIYGIGINNLNEPVRVNGKNLKSYITWKSMLQRCYSEKRQERYPSYVGCSVCDEWLLLSNFVVWFNANYRDGMELDKDILIQGNKVYCPEACRFVPGYINTLLTNAEAIRGNLPCGVVAVKPNSHGQINTTYTAYCRDGHGKQLNRTFKTVEGARQWYITTKKKVVKEIVLESFWRNEILSDVATALLERKW